MSRRVLLTIRAGHRWSRRVKARIASRRSNPAATPELRRLEDQADRLFLRLRELDGPEPFAKAIAAEQARPDRNPDDPDDDR